MSVNGKYNMSVYGKYNMSVNGKYNMSVYGKSKKEGNAQESIEWSTTPDPGHHIGKWQNTIKHHIQENQEASLVIINAVQDIRWYPGKVQFMFVYH